MKLTLYPELLIQAYSTGYFPMPDPETDKIVFLRPEPRAMIPLESFHCSRSLKKLLYQQQFSLSFDQAFRHVMQGCANREDTWITQEFFEGYENLFKLKLAHSVEVWKNSQLAGGVYGVSLGSAFFAESKFHSVDNASKVALFYLVEYLKKSGFTLLEVQFMTPYLEGLGARAISNDKYLRLLKKALLHNKEFKPALPWLVHPDEFKK